MKTNLGKWALCFALFFAFSACSDDDDNNGPANGPDGKRLVKQLKETYYEDGEKMDVTEYNFKYDGDGRLKSINSKSTYISEDDDKKYTDNGSVTITISEKTLKVVDKYYETELKEDIDSEGTYKLNEDMYIKSGELSSEFDGGYDYSYSFSYDEDGYLVSSKRDGSSYTYYWTNGDMTKGEYSSSFVYTDKVNKAGFDFTACYDEGMISIQHWYLRATGYLGKNSKHLLKSSAYDTYEYTFNDDGLVKTIKEISKHGWGDSYTLFEVSYN